jgi:hypothetical protein
MITGKRRGKLTEYNIIYNGRPCRLVVHEKIGQGIIVDGDVLRLLDEAEVKNYLSQRVDETYEYRKEAV